MYWPSLWCHVCWTLKHSCHLCPHLMGSLSRQMVSHILPVRGNPELLNQASSHRVLLHLHESRKVSAGIPMHLPFLCREQYQAWGCLFTRSCTLVFTTWHHLRIPALAPWVNSRPMAISPVNHTENSWEQVWASYQTLAATEEDLHFHCQTIEQRFIQNIWEYVPGRTLPRRRSSLHLTDQKLHFPSNRTYDDTTPGGKDLTSLRTPSRWQEPCDTSDEGPSVDAPCSHHSQPEDSHGFCLDILELSL